MTAVVVDDALGLDPKQLLLVVPLVEGFGLVEALVALQADEPGTGQLGHRLGELRLAGARRPLDQHRFAQPVGQVDDAAAAGADLANKLILLDLASLH